MGFNTGATWEIVIDGRPRSYRDNLEIAREAARYLKSKNPKSEVAIRNCATGEALPMTVKHEAVAWADGKKARR
jgi:hypothetical protein